MQIRLVKPGMLSTVQDLGRAAHLAAAIPVCGVMDTLSATIANIACGNSDNSAVIEFTYADASFYTETDILIAYAGYGAQLTSNEKLLPPGKPTFIPAGSTIVLTPDAQGCRTYLAIAGGWDVPVMLGSSSTCLVAGFGGYNGRALRKNDVLNNTDATSRLSKAIFDSLKGNNIKCGNWSIAHETFLPHDRNIIRITPGPEFTWFSAASILNFLSDSYQLTTECNRMGCRLKGEAIERVEKKELISTAVTPGTIQVSGDGSLILLMADCQTTGGYPRIAQVAAVDMPLCAQLKPGDKIFFSEISRHEAETLYLERQNELMQLQEAIRVKYNVAD